MPDLPHYPYADATALPASGTWGLVLDMTDAEDYEDPDDGIVRTYCGSCGRLDCIVEVDRAERWNALDAESLVVDDDGTLHVPAILGTEFAWNRHGWRCVGCDDDELTAPSNIRLHY